MSMASIIPGLRFGYNKVFVNEAERKKKLFEGLIPKLKSRKGLLYLSVQEFEERLEEFSRGLDDARRAAEWADSVEDYIPTMEHETVTARQVVAGVEVDAYQEVRFDIAPYSLFATPASTDTAVESRQGLTEIEEKIRVTEVAKEILQEEFEEVSRQLAVFEDKFVPWLDGAIRKVKLTLGDEEALQAGISGMIKKRREENVTV